MRTIKIRRPEVHLGPRRDVAKCGESWGSRDVKGHPPPGESDRVADKGWKH